MDSESDHEDDNYFDDVNLPHTYQPTRISNFIERKSSDGNIYVEYTGNDNISSTQDVV